MVILLIEDDVFFQKFYSLKLKESGFEVDIASNGEEGLSKLRFAHFDVVLLDLIMPVKNGFEVLEELSKDQNLKNIPVLVFSTLGQEQDILKAKSLGAVDHVNKTFFDFDDLLRKIFVVTKT